jgi:hypothetical protein
MDLIMSSTVLASAVSSPVRGNAHSMLMTVDRDGIQL